MTDPLQQHLVPFYGDELVAVQQEDGTICVLFGRLCENLGLDRRGQVRRTQRHSVLDKGLLALEVQTAGGLQTLQCLKLSLLPLWLSGVQARRVKPELQEKLVRYQEEAADVLWQAFKPQILAADTAVVSVDDSHAVQQLQQIAEMGRAITRMAEQQIELQRQQQALTQRMDGAARVIRGVQQDVQGLRGHLSDVEVRLGVLEDRLHPAASVTDEQATQVSNQVKALAELLSGTEHGKNHYQGIFAELYRRFGVSSYKLIRQDQYTAVLRFLEDWRRTSGG
jgi:hypothetical protein